MLLAVVVLYRVAVRLRREVLDGRRGHPRLELDPRSPSGGHMLTRWRPRDAGLDISQYVPEDLRRAQDEVDRSRASDTD
jgi:hypothetical protein